MSVMELKEYKNGSILNKLKQEEDCPKMLLTTTNFWFNEVELDVNDCIFDPTCIQEKGACFSCLHLPEYVCSEFNEDLDRDVFIGEHRYNTGFWNKI